MPNVLARLKKRADFLRIAAERRKWAAPGLILQAAPVPQTEADVTRVGFTCSKKVGNAVARNRARRRLKAAAAELMPELATPGLDYVVIGRPETVSRPYSLLLQDLRAALKRVGTPRGGATPRGRTAETQGP
jgi:ribonuclease P protein component